MRWREGSDPTEVRFDAPEGAALQPAELRRRRRRDRARLDLRRARRSRPRARTNGAVAAFDAPGGTAAITLRGGIGDPERRDAWRSSTPTARRSRWRCRRARRRPSRARWPSRSARPLANCTSVAFDASASTGDGAARLSLALRRRRRERRAGASPIAFAAPGRYEAELEVLGRGDRVGRGARVAVPVHVRAAPVAVAGDPVTAAPGEPVAFDGAASIAERQPDHPLPLDLRRRRRGRGRDRDATPTSARASTARCCGSRTPRTIPATSAWRPGIVTVNFPPVAEAGEARTAAVGETVTLGGGASYDVDGTIAAHRWDLGDGTPLDGATVTHAYAGARRLRRDPDGRATTPASPTPRPATRVTIAVNAPPVPVATGPDRPIAVGEIAPPRRRAARPTPTARSSSWSWDFGDGAKGEGPRGAVRLGRARRLSGDR